MWRVRSWRRPRTWERECGVEVGDDKVAHFLGSRAGLKHVVELLGHYHTLIVDGHTAEKFEEVGVVEAARMNRASALY